MKEAVKPKPEDLFEKVDTPEVVKEPQEPKKGCDLFERIEVVEEEVKKDLDEVETPRKNKSKKAKKEKKEEAEEENKVSSNFSKEISVFLE